jgi:hypothetical protein
MDVTDENPPVDGLVANLPTLVLLPAHDKEPPFLHYSGLAKVLPLMQWVQEHASVHFALPNLPHLHESERDLYKSQVTEREEYLAEKRRTEAEEIAREDDRQAQWRAERGLDEL